MSAINLRRAIRLWIGIFIFFLVLSGVTAFPLQLEVHFLINYSYLFPSAFETWLQKIYLGLTETSIKYPFLAYGTDWLAFAHFVIAVAFIGPLKDPIKNIWVIQFGMIACLMVVPLAFICGAIRNIPLFWQLIDCSFGICGFIPLRFAYRLIVKLQNQPNQTI